MNDPKKKEQPVDAIPVMEEAAVVDKKSVVTGRVRVRTITGFVDDVAHATLEKQNIEIRRVPIDQIVDTPPLVRTEGDITIIPVLESSPTAQQSRRMRLAFLHHYSLGDALHMFLQVL